MRDTVPETKTRIKCIKRARGVTKKAYRKIKGALDAKRAALDVLPYSMAPGSERSALVQALLAFPQGGAWRRFPQALVQAALFLASYNDRVAAAILSASLREDFPKWLEEEREVLAILRTYRKTK